ncbi:MAG: hypothetical protein ACP5QG_01005 [candidate division WOR-3 bacterium]
MGAKPSPGFRIGGVHYTGSELIDEWFKGAHDLEPYLDADSLCRPICPGTTGGMFRVLTTVKYLFLHRKWITIST